MMRSYPGLVFLPLHISVVDSFDRAVLVWAACKALISALHLDTNIRVPMALYTTRELCVLGQSQTIC